MWVLRPEASCLEWEILMARALKTSMRGRETVDQEGADRILSGGYGYWRWTSRKILVERKLVANMVRKKAVMGRMAVMERMIVGETRLVTEGTNLERSEKEENENSGTVQMRMRAYWTTGTKTEGMQALYSVGQDTHRILPYSRCV